MTPVAFYTPVKHPYEPEPSGDRELGRLLMAALRGLGLAPHLASRLLTYRRAFDPVDATRVERIAALTAGRLIARYRRARPQARPHAWVTYQSYYRAPDLIGPVVATALGIPYVLVDTAVSTRSRRTPFRPWVSAARLAVRRADLIFLMSRRDWPRVTACRGPRFATDRILDLPPAVDTMRFDASAERRAACRADLAGRFPQADGPVILAVAAMREVKKLDAYRLLASALARVHASAPERPWRLAVVGDGPARPAVAAALGTLPSGRVAFLGRSSPRRFPPRISAPISSPSPVASTSPTCRPPPPPSPWSRARGPIPTRWSPRTVRSSLPRRPTPSPRASPVSSTIRPSGTPWGPRRRRFVAADRTFEAFQRRLAGGLAILGVPCARSTSR